MAGRDTTNGSRQSCNTKVLGRRLVSVGGAAAAFLAAAAVATGSASPAKADLDDLLDPILQPILTQVTDSLTSFDPALATDLTSWTDTVLADLNSLDTTTAAAATAASAAASSASSGLPTTGGTDIPITMAEGTEPTVQSTVDGADTTLLVDTGSSGLVIPYTDLGSSLSQQLESLFSLGAPSSMGESGYSGGVDYIYLTYDDVSTDYGNGALDTTGPVDVEIFSWPTSFSSPANFQDFLNDNDVTGILGIGDNTAGPTESPFQADGDTGVLVDVPAREMVVDPIGNNGVPIDGAPISTVYETVTTPSGVVTGATVSDDVDSGGVYGTIPSSLASDVEPGSLISVYESNGDGGGGTELYQYEVTADNAPTSTSGTSIDSGIEPFDEEPIFVDYLDDTDSFDGPF